MPLRGKCFQKWVYEGLREFFANRDRLCYPNCTLLSLHSDMLEGEVYFARKRKVDLLKAVLKKSLKDFVDDYLRIKAV